MIAMCHSLTVDWNNQNGTLLLFSVYQTNTIKTKNWIKHLNDKMYYDFTEKRFKNCTKMMVGINATVPVKYPFRTETPCSDQFCWKCIKQNKNALLWIHHISWTIPRSTHNVIQRDIRYECGKTKQCASGLKWTDNTWDEWDGNNNNNLHNCIHKRIHTFFLSLCIHSSRCLYVLVQCVYCVLNDSNQNAHICIYERGMLCFNF